MNSVKIAVHNRGSESNPILFEEEFKILSNLELNDNINHPITREMCKCFEEQIKWTGQNSFKSTLNLLYILSHFYVIFNNNFRHCMELYLSLVYFSRCTYHQVPTSQHGNKGNSSNVYTI